MTTAFGIRSKRVVRRVNHNARKGKATKRIARTYTAIKCIADRMSFSGTQPAFDMLLDRLVALRKGVDSAKTPEGIQAQVVRARGYQARAVTMSTWGPRDFAIFYEEMGIVAPSSLGQPARHKRRLPENPLLQAETSLRDGTEPNKRRCNPKTDQGSKDSGINLGKKSDPEADAFQMQVDASEKEALSFLAMKEAVPRANP